MEKKEDIEELDKSISTKLLELQKDDAEKELEQLMTIKKSKIDPVSKVAIFDPNEVDDGSGF